MIDNPKKNEYDKATQSLAQYAINSRSSYNSSCSQDTTKSALVPSIQSNIDSLRDDINNIDQKMKERLDKLKERYINSGSKANRNMENSVKTLKSPSTIKDELSPPSGKSSATDKKQAIAELVMVKDRVNDQEKKIKELQQENHGLKSQLEKERSEKQMLASLLTELESKVTSSSGLNEEEAISSRNVRL